MLLFQQQHQDQLKIVLNDDRMSPRIFKLNSKIYLHNKINTGFSFGSAKNIVICVSNSPQPLSSTSNGACVTTKTKLSFLFFHMKILLLA